MDGLVLGEGLFFNVAWFRVFSFGDGCLLIKATNNKCCFNSCCLEFCKFKGKAFLLEAMRQNPLNGKGIFSPN